ncbi:MAG: hypothetical protein WA996_05710 [Candidatus Promineifilaceae bacterium]
MRRSSIFAGLILIGAGVLFLLMPLFPNVSDLLNINQQWPLIIILVGGMFLLGAFLGSPGLAVPGTLISGLGLLMYYQNTNNAWNTWAFAWTLIFVFIGIGIILSHAIGGNLALGLRQGGRLVVIGLILFLVFGSFLGSGFTSSVGLAILLIGIGLWMAARVIFRGKRGDAR